MNNVKISTRMVGTFGALVVLLLAVIGAALSQLASIYGSTSDIAGNWLPSVELVNRLDAQLSQARLNEFRHLTTQDPAAKAEAEKALGDIRARIKQTETTYQALINSDEERRLYQTYTEARTKYGEMAGKLLELSRKNETEQALALLQGESRQWFMQASDTLAKLVALNSEGAKAASASAASVYLSARLVMGAAAVVAIILALVAATWLIRSITRPLAQAVEAADRVAAGDLSGHIVVQSRDETGHLLSALQRMQQSLVTTVTTVRGNAESVASASAQIASGNNDLSARTEQQASALEETAASMEELGSTVRQNADNARQANQLALSASTVAVQGGDVVAEVVETMKGINASSSKIADIISVIDGIAFQTNILALNAAVEAARAGEQGRGFAVVAGEVRSLAQRSAEAAKEIKSLITASVERVEQGTLLVDKAGATMTEVVASIRRVTDIMGEISAASSEQSAGVGQVGEAVTQMDQATQQNAALVEEMAAAASSLNSQAGELVNAVAVFRLAAGEGVSHRAPAATAAPAVRKPTATAPPRPLARPAPAAPAKAPATPPQSLAPSHPAASASRTATAGGDDEWESF